MNNRLFFGKQLNVPTESSMLSVNQRYHSRTSRIGSALWVSALVCLISLTPAWAMTRGGQEGRAAGSFEGMLARIHGPLEFSLDCCSDIALRPGMVRTKNTNPRTLKVIEQVLRSSRWACTSFGTPKRGEPQNVWCNAEDGTLLSKLLLDRGVVVERCEVSGNQFGTC